MPAALFVSELQTAGGLSMSQVYAYSGDLMADIPEKQHPASSASFWPFWLAILITLSFCVAGLVMGIPGEAFLKENGPIENASVAIFLCGGIGFAVMRPDLAFGKYWQVTAIMLLFAARELDFDKRFMDKGILQLRLYSGDYPLEQKLIGAAFVLFILLTLYRLFRYGARPVLRGLKEGAAWAWAVVLAGITVVVAKSLDGADRKLAPFGIELSADASKLFAVLEEGGELAFGLMLVFAICSWVHRDASRRAREAEFPSGPNGL